MERLGHGIRPLLALILLISVIWGALPAPLYAEDLPPEPVVDEVITDDTELPIDPLPTPPSGEEASTAPSDPVVTSVEPLSSEAPEEIVVAMEMTEVPVITDFYWNYMPHRYGGESGDTYQTALKAGDFNYNFYLFVTTGSEDIEIIADMTELGLSDSVPLFIEGPINAYAGRGFAAEMDYAEGYHPIPEGVADGLKHVRVTIREGAAEVTETLPIYVDNTPPSMTIASATRSEEVLVGGSTLLLSGEIADATSDTRVYEIWQREYDAAGNMLTEFMTHGMSGNEAAYALTKESFSDVAITLQSQDGSGTLNPNAASISFSFLIVDEAGNQATYATDRIPVVGELPPAEPAVSNVLFLPGIKGSRLYSDSDGKHWIPSGDTDVQALFLDALGRSTRDDIHVRVGDIIAEVEVPILGNPRFYKSFISSMDTLQAAGTITDWEAVPYDWRLSLPDIINNGLEEDGKIYYTQATSTPYIEQTLRQLAASSKTGKVTIVAHSNGGLVAKALMQKLGDAETAALIDDVVFVGVPQLGAPQALAAILYGYGESLPNRYFPALVSSSASRSLAENTPMAYHLLPTDTYFNEVPAEDRKLVRFSGEEAYTKEVAAYDLAIDSWDELRRFVTATEGGREKPDEADLDNANIGNATLLSYAEDVHSDLDTWLPPDGVHVHQIAGWGVETLMGIELREISLPWFGTVQRDYLPVFSMSGDQTVPSKSSSAIQTGSNVSSYWIDLDKVSDRIARNYSHADLLEIDSLTDLISQILTNESKTGLPEDIFDSEPTIRDEEDWFRFFLHSPLSIEVFDDEGNRVGLNEDGTLDAEIEGGEYATFGEVHYITVPAGKNYTVILDGYDEGFFSLDVQEIDGTSVTQSATFAGIPAKPETTARLEVFDTINEETSLSVDFDGDEIEDANLIASTTEITLYVPASEEASSDSEGSSSNYKKKEDTSTDSVGVDKPISIPADAIELKLPHATEPLVLTKEVQGEVLGALDSITKDKESPKSKLEREQANMFSAFTTWVYNLLISIFEKILSLFSFTYAH